MSKVTFTVNNKHNLHLLLLFAEALGLEATDYEDDDNLNGNGSLLKKESTLKTIRKQIKKAKEDLGKDF